MKKLTLFKLSNDQTTHGGSTRVGKRKTKRFFQPRKPIHIVMRASKARGELNFLKAKNSQIVNQVIQTQSKKYYVKIYEYVNVGNHLHIKAKGYSRETFANFLRTTAAMIVRKITKARKGTPFGKFWDALAFTRILKTSFEEKVLNKYFNANALEARFGKEIREIFLHGWPE